MCASMCCCVFVTIVCNDSAEMPGVGGKAFPSARGYPVADASHALQEAVSARVLPPFLSPSSYSSLSTVVHVCSIHRVLLRGWLFDVVVAFYIVDT